MCETGSSKPSSVILEEEKIDLYHPVVFGVSFAFFALNLLPDPETCDHHWLQLRNRMLNGGTHLLGLLTWRVQMVEEEKSRKNGLMRKLECAERQIEELKKRRSEEAKANARVMSIVAAREQSWLCERKMLRQQIGDLVNELRILETNMEQSVSELNDRIRDNEDILHDKDRSIEEAEKKREEVEILVDDLRERAKVEAQSHSDEILRYKTALIELVSTQRHLEAELGRAVRQGEAVRQEVDSVLDHKERVVLMNQRLSMEIVKLRKDVQQKDQILSAVVRKSMANTAEKEMKSASKAVRKQEEIERKNDGRVLRNLLLYKHVKGHQHQQPELRKGLDNMDVEAFVEQLRLKDEKLETLQWSLLNMELESKRFQSYIQGIEHEVVQLRHENRKLETELNSVKEQLEHGNVWSNMKIMERKPGHGSQEIKAAAAAALDVDDAIIPVHDQLKDIVLLIKEGGNVAASDSSRSNVIFFGTSTSQGQEMRNRTNNHSMWKMDLHALGVSYKIKRLKQQLLMLERLTGKQEECCDNGNEQSAAAKGFDHPLTHLLNKQADRYQSLQTKTDDLYQRIKDDNLNLNSGCSSIARSLDETNRLENYLDETFQLQRFIVATGQKLTEVQAKILSGFESEEEKLEKVERFNVKEFADSMRTLFREVQRGLEIRISRIIGDLEGTLACNGIIHLKK